MAQKLYVWHDSLECSFSSGVMFALANSIEEAREVILQSDWSTLVAEDLKSDPKVYDSPVGFTVWGGD